MFSEGYAFSQENSVVPPVLNVLPETNGKPRIVLMLHKDVGREAPNPIDPELLERLSLRAGMDLGWEANTRSNGQILSLPFAATVEQARQAAKALSLESGVLWADVEAGGTLVQSRAATPKSDLHDGTDKISRFIVKIRGDNLSSALDSGLLTTLVSATGLNLKVAYRTTKARILSLEEPISLERAKAAQNTLEQLPNLIYADPDQRGNIQTAGAITPNDPLFWRNWHLQGLNPALNPGPPYGYNGYGGAANIQAAWRLTRGRAATGVAVVDSGILFDHPDLRRSLGRQKNKRGWDMISVTAPARDGNARDSDAQDEGDWLDAAVGCNGVLKPSSWHGSHVAGIIAATTNNGVGVSGVNWRARIVPVRVLGACGFSTADMNDGIFWAAGNQEVPDTQPNRTPVKVINLSIGGPGTCSSASQEAIDYALSKGISVVAAAGNDAKDVTGMQPANCHGVISVAALNQLGDLAFYSNYGKSVTIAAPGGQKNFLGLTKDPTSGKVTPSQFELDWGIWSTVNSSPTTLDKGEMTYGSLQGTSMAAPVVSGVVSLMYAADRRHKLTPGWVIKILQDTAGDFLAIKPILLLSSSFDWSGQIPTSCTTDRTGECGAGVVDAEAALKAVHELR
jgi:serine protease